MMFFVGILLRCFGQQCLIFYYSCLAQQIFPYLLYLVVASPVRNLNILHGHKSIHATQEVFTIFNQLCIDS